MKFFKIFIGIILVVIIIGAMVLFVLFRINKKESFKETKLSDEFMLERAGAKMPVWIHGNPDNKILVVTLHGGPGLGHGLDFRRGLFSEALEEEYLMVYWDQRHMGSASGKLTKDQLSIDHMKKDIAFLIESLRETYGEDYSIFLMGHSWGGTMSSLFVANTEHQKELSGFINVSGAVDVVGEEAYTVETIKKHAQDNLDREEKIEEWKTISKKLSKIKVDKNKLSYMTIMRVSRQENKALDLVLDKINEPQYRQSEFNSIFRNPGLNLFTLIYNVSSLPFTDFWSEYRNLSFMHELENVKLPTMLVFGRYDFGASENVGQDIYDALGSKDKHLFIYEKSEHAPFDTEPELFIKHMTEFIDTYKKS